MRQPIIITVWILLYLPSALWALDVKREVKYRHGLLWKIEGSNIKSSYVFGTMHSDDDRIIALVDKIRPEIQASQLVCTEVKFSFQSIDRASKVMYFDDGQTLKTVIGNALFKQSSQALSNQGFSVARVDQLKPWAVAVLLNQPDAGMMVLDMAIYNEALIQEKKVCGLENVAEQIQTFSGMEVKDQVAILRETLAMMPQIPVLYQELIEVYLQRDLAKVMALNWKYSLKDKKLMKRFMTRLLDDRNQRMVRRMLIHMLSRNAFFAVGALHLPGESGILGLLEKKGLKVSHVY